MDSTGEARMNVARFEANVDAIQAELNRLAATTSSSPKQEDK